MLFSPILLLAATAAAFTIPAGQPDGVYSVHTGTDGQEVHTFMSDLPNEVSPRDDRYVNRRQISNMDNVVGCGNYPLNQNQVDAAANGLKSQCGAGAEVSKGRDFYSLSGCTVVYFCNLSQGGSTCMEYLFNLFFPMVQIFLFLPYSNYSLAG